MENKPNLSNITPELKEKMLQWEKNKPEFKQLQVMEDVADMVQELVTLGDISKESTEKLGALLADAREQLIKLNSKESPESPDFSKPIIEALGKLQKAFESKDYKPTIKVDAPKINVPTPVANVTVDAPNVDVSGIEKLLKTEMPKAFEKAISLIPEPVQADNSEIIEKFTEMNELLSSIEHQSRKKPLPGVMKVTNADGTAIGGGALSTSAKGATAVGSPTSTNASADRTLLDVTLRDTSGNAVSVGGGTQYADGAVRGTPTGTVMMVDDGTNIQSAKGDSAGRLDVNINGTVPVSGTVAVTNAGITSIDGKLPSGLTVTASRLQVELPAGGSGLTNTELRASAVPVSGTVTATGPLTDTQLRATPVPVSGTISTGLVQGLTDTQLRATPVPISGTVTSTPSGTTTVAGTVTANIGTSGSLALDATLTGGTQKAITRGGAKGTAAAADITSNPISANAQLLHVDGSLVTQPVSIATMPTTPVTGTFFQATQPVSLATAPSTPVTNAGTFAVQAAATLAAETTKVIGTVNIAAAQTLANVTTVGTITNTVPTKQVRSATPAQSSPSVTTGNTVVLASSANRLGATIYNEGSVACFVKLGATASATSYSVKMAVDGYYEVPFNYTGAIDGITASGTATLRVTELT